MRRRLTLPGACLGLLFLLPVLGGCGGKAPPPPVTEVEGAVQFTDGTPLANAQVEFVPQVPGYGAELNSTALTDGKGPFRLTHNQKQEPGAVVARHKVVITDPAMPAELRGMSEKHQRAQDEFMAKMRSRGEIPEAYKSPVQTPLEIEVTADR